VRRLIYVVPGTVKETVPPLDLPLRHTTRSILGFLLDGANFGRRVLDALAARRSANAISA
jgi:hypothetical protein